MSPLRLWGLKDTSAFLLTGGALLYTPNTPV